MNTSETSTHADDHEPPPSELPNEKSWRALFPGLAIGLGLAFLAGLSEASGTAQALLASVGGIISAGALLQYVRQKRDESGTNAGLVIVGFGVGLVVGAPAGIISREFMNRSLVELRTKQERRLLEESTKARHELFVWVKENGGLAENPGFALGGSNGQEKESDSISRAHLGSLQALSTSTQKHLCDVVLQDVTECQKNLDSLNNTHRALAMLFRLQCSSASKPDANCEKIERLFEKDLPGCSAVQALAQDGCPR